MKKTLKVIVALVLCCCIIMPTTAAFAQEDEATYASVEEYVADAQNDEGTDSSLKTKIALAKLLNKLSNFVINGVLGTALNLIIPDSAAVDDFEEFDIDKRSEAHV